MKRIVLALCITLAASFAFAGEPHMKMRMMGPDPGEIAATLGLSAGQKAQWDSIHQQLQANVEPLFQQLRAAHEQLESLASASNPDATAVGTQFLAARSLEKQVKAAHEAAHQKLTALLTPDQKAKFDSLHQEMGPGHGHGPMEMHMRHPEPGSRE
ncbi:MAG: Heavy-metal resistance [Thermoanaerobaculia bacterium]|jgi:Spy/CpxP family protein refolding chaperone|nr:Heavy-metal resistance [Thermoanaerobaculia bacterium]